MYRVRLIVYSLMLVPCLAAGCDRENKEFRSRPEVGGNRMNIAQEMKQEPRYGQTKADQVWQQHFLQRKRDRNADLRMQARVLQEAKDQAREDAPRRKKYDGDRLF